MNSANCHVAIVGTGPAGFYTAEALADNPAVRIDMIDRLPTPYGLIRGGVAPDHQSIKAVARRYEKTALRKNVRFLGNLTVGCDVGIEELLALYDAVVLATGAPEDRPLGIPGADLPGVVGSAAFVGWYNSHPDFADLDIDLDTASVAVIGNGNVALDVARILAKTPDEMAQSDIAPYAVERIARAPIRDIHIFGRRGPLQAHFTPKELGEMGELERAVPLVDPQQLPDEEEEATLEPARRKIISILRDFSRNRPDDKPLHVHFRFFAQPVEIMGSERVCCMRLEHTRLEGERAVGTGRFFEVPCGLVIPCIGYRTSPIPGVPYDERAGRFVNEEGLIGERLYCVGWARRGPTGTIGTNRPDGAAIAARICEEVTPSGREGGAGLDRLIAARGLEVVRFSDWQRIDAAECAAATPPHPRLKFAHITDMLEAAREKRLAD
ncbi:MAG: pyridine nucleotide-disulfide oxidoreductase [Alphaproteobacteria bacterium]|nr:MAG: pyridine nucleotide-disulfide oxidoreductase [Alphaproteobacteria bacterium]